jgi:acyl-CoA synthetase (AMP-forming)/AMP-acid ligase II
MQVFGVPDPKVGEEICVYLRLKSGIKLTDKDIINYCKDKVRGSLLTELTARILNLFPSLSRLINHLVQFLDLSTFHQSVGLSVDYWSFTWQATTTTCSATMREVLS